MSPFWTCRWLVDNQRLAVNPLAGLIRLNTEVDVRHKRRALSADEVVRLVHSARESEKTIQGYGGELRARSYLFSYMTGLRRKEMASLTPASFDLTSTPPTVTVEAACSKHRREDILALHPDLVRELTTWLAGMSADQTLFPRLDRKKTWLMVKMDLESIGIPYETADGVADFHAAGRHSHVTELFRSGAKPTQVKELARHSDIRMTMRYTHMGLSDQAEALAGLRSPIAEPAKTDEPTEANGISRLDEPAKLRDDDLPVFDTDEEVWQYIGSTLVVVERLLESLAVTEVSSTPEVEKRKKPRKTWPFDADCHSDVTDDTEAKKWRRRESNPDGDFYKHFNGLQLAEDLPPDTAPMQRAMAITGHSLTSECHTHHERPSAVHRIGLAWQHLPPHIRDAILTLVDAGLSTGFDPSPKLPHLFPVSDRSEIDELEAWRMARECRGVIQNCLREEEWKDAESEFFDIIAVGTTPPQGRDLSDDGSGILAR